MAAMAPSVGRCLHLPPALAHQAHAVGQREHAGGDHRAVLAHRVAGVEGGVSAGVGAGGHEPPSSARRSAIDVARSAGWALIVRSSCSAGPSKESRDSGSSSARRPRRRLPRRRRGSRSAGPCRRTGTPGRGRQTQIGTRVARTVSSGNAGVLRDLRAIMHAL